MSAIFRVSKRNNIVRPEELIEIFGLESTDDTVHVNLINRETGIHVVSWTPTTAEFKGDGLIGEAVDSPVADFDESRFARWGRIQETVTVNASAFDQDGLAAMLSKLEVLLRYSSEFWRNEWSEEIVYLTVKGKDETNPRYAILYGGRIESSPDIFNQPFLQRDASSVSGEFTISLIRGHWTDTIPGEESCLPIMKRSSFDNYTVAMQNLAPVYRRVVGGYQLRSLSDNLVAMWPLDETSGTVSQEVIGNFDASYDLTYATLDAEKFIDNSPVIAQDTAAGQAWSIISHAGLSALWAQGGTERGGLCVTGSISLWFKANSTFFSAGNQGTIIGVTQSDPGVNENGLDLFKGATTWRLAWSSQDDSSLSVETISYADMQSFFVGNDEDLWQNITIVWDSSGFVDSPGSPSETGKGYISLFVNGHLAIQIVGITPWTNISLVTMSMGASAGWSGSLYRGPIMLFDKALTPPEIGEIMSPNFFVDRENCSGTFVSNHYLDAVVNYVYTYDASLTSYTDRSGQVVPFNLLPTNYDVGDILYIGSHNSRFNNVVFNISRGTGSNMTWEYWDGSAWTTLPSFVDQTRSLRLDGVGAVIWGLPSDWARNDPGMGVLAYWIRGRVTSKTSLSTYIDPQQVDDIIVAATKPYVETPVLGAGGDIPALASLRVDMYGPLAVNQVIVGKRSLKRGKSFSAYLNASNANLPPGVVTEPGNSTTLVTDSTFPGLGYYRFDPTVASSTFSSIVHWMIGQAVSGQYYGLYRAVLAVVYTGVSTGDVRLRLTYDTPLGLSVPFQIVTPNPGGSGESTNYIDMGLFSMPPPGSGSISVNLQAQVVDPGTWTLDIAVLYLIPADEWISESTTSAQNLAFTTGDSLLINSTHRSNLHGRTNSRIVDQTRSGPFTINISDYANFSATGKLEAHHGRQERFWFFFRGEPTTVVNEQAIYRVRGGGERRYLGLRGSR